MNNEKLSHIEFADKIAAFSKDPSSKIGAIFTDSQKLKQPCFGYNGMPRGLDDNHPERNERPEKYFWYEHAERNAIYNKARETLEGSIIFSSEFPNMEAARAVTSSGIKTCVVPVSSNWYEQLKPEQLAMIERVKTLFKETGVEIIEINKSEIDAGFNPYNYDNNISYNVEQAIKEFSMKEKYSKYLDLAEAWGQQESRDYDNKSGAIILNAQTLNPLGMGAYNPPERLKEITDDMRKPENKSLFFQEAIKNAVFSSVKAYFTGMDIDVNKCPCNHCALAVVEVGARKVRTRALDFNNEMDLRWKDSFEKTNALFEMTGVELETFNIPEPEVKTKKTKFKR